VKQALKRILGKKMIARIRAIQYRAEAVVLGLGDSVECNICETSFFRFLSFAGGENIWCPRCGSVGRHRLLHAFLREETAFYSRRMRVLHFAPEVCLSGRFRKVHDYVSADLGITPIANVSARPDVVMSVTAIDYPDNLFDVVICNHVLEHVREDTAAMKEILRVLRPAGWAILQVPINVESEVTLEDPSLTPEERARQYLFADHVRYYGLDYPERLRAIGFEVRESDFAARLDAARLRTDPSEVIYVCTKP
jgi:SAM-dependent methyltransferase